MAAPAVANPHEREIESVQSVVLSLLLAPLLAAGLDDDSGPTHPLRLLRMAYGLVD